MHKEFTYFLLNFQSSVMKNISISILFSLQSLVLFSQTTSDMKREILYDVIIDQATKPLDFENTKIADAIYSNFMASELEILRDAMNRDMTFRNTSNTDSITITNEESGYIFNFFLTQYNLSQYKNIKNLELINSKYKYNYLMSSNNHQIILISQPLLLRDGKIALVFLAKACCKEDLHLFTNFSLYKRNEHGKWQTWIVMIKNDIQ